MFSHFNIPSYSPRWRRCGGAGTPRGCPASASADARQPPSSDQNFNVADLIEVFQTAAAQASSLAEPWIQEIHAHLVKPQSAAKNNEKSPITTTTDNKFEVEIDISEFAQEEINVKVVDNSILIEAKHEEKEDKQGFVSRQFVRRFILPEGVILEKMTCKMAKDNTIIISAPRVVQKPENNEKTIPITIVRQSTPIAPTPTPTSPSAPEYKFESSSDEIADFVKI